MQLIDYSPIPIHEVSIQCTLHAQVYFFKAPCFSLVSTSSEDHISLALHFVMLSDMWMTNIFKLILFQPHSTFSTFQHQFQIYSKGARKTKTLHSGPPDAPRTWPHTQLSQHYWLYSEHARYHLISKLGRVRPT